MGAKSKLGIGSMSSPGVNSGRRRLQGFYAQRSAVSTLLIINTIAFIIQMFSNKFTEIFMLTSADVFTRPYILVTHMFLHANFTHILFNMYALWMFGMILEQKIGTKQFYILYFSAGIIAGFVASFFYPAALGASAAIMAVIGALVVIMPNLKLLFFFIIPMPFWVAGIFWAALDVFGIFVPSGIGNIAHLVGMAIGILFSFYLIQKRKKFTSSASYSTKVNLTADEAQDFYEKYNKYGRV